MGTNSQAGLASAEHHPTGVTPPHVSVDGRSEEVDGSSPDQQQAGSTKTGEVKVSRSDVPGPKPRHARHAHLFVTNLDPWSVMKSAFMFAVAMGIVMIVAVMVLWAMLSTSGTFDSIARTVSDVVGDGPQSINVSEYFSFSKVVGTAAVLAALEVVLTTALITLFAFLYNIAVGITGGLQITLTNDS